MPLDPFNNDNTIIADCLKILPALIAEGIKDPTNPQLNAQIAGILNMLQGAANDLDKMAYGSSSPDQAAALQEVTANTGFVSLFGFDFTGQGLTQGDFNTYYLFNQDKATAATVQGALDYLGAFSDSNTQLVRDMSNFQNPAPPV